jgi:hypothetical protein
VVTWNQLCQLAGALPDVTVGTWYGTPGLKVRDKGFVRLKEDAATVVFLLDSIDAQEALIEAMPAVYFITDHYKGSRAVLARLAKLSPAEARDRLEHAWRQKASPALIAAQRPAGERTAAAASPRKPRRR